jgi:succinate dehydrogenase / fumarate reductase cytochrome b subunit
MVSILHRVSGALMFLLLPFIVWMFDVSVSSEVSYERLHQRLRGRHRLPAGLVLIKLVALALIWAYLHHFIAGMRHLWMDMTHSVTKEQGHMSAMATLAHQHLLTLAWAPSCSACTDPRSPGLSPSRHVATITAPSASSSARTTACATG